MPKKPASDAPLPSFGDDDEHASTRAFRSPLLDDDDGAGGERDEPDARDDGEETGRSRREPPSTGGVEIDTRPVPLPRFPSADDVTRPVEPLQTLPTLPLFADDSTSRPLVPTRSSSRMVVAPWARLAGDPDAPASSRQPFAPPTAPTLPIAPTAPTSSSFVPVAAASFTPMSTPMSQPAAAPLGAGFPPSAALAATLPATPPSVPAPSLSASVAGAPHPSQPSPAFPVAPPPAVLPAPSAPAPSLFARLAWGVLILGVSAVVGGGLASWLAPKRAPRAPVAPSASPSVSAPAPPPPSVASVAPPPAGGRPAKLSGAIELPPSSAGAQLWLDGELTPYGTGPLVVPCGRHVVKVAGPGRHPQVASLDVPCGGRVVLP